MKKNLTLLLSGLILLLLQPVIGSAQDDNYIRNKTEHALLANYLQVKPAFEKAYQQYPSVPRGVLEAIAFTNTHFRHISEQSDEAPCNGMPRAYGVMGMIKDGQQYFRENLAYISHLSGYPAEQIISDPEINILAYARAYETLQSQKSLANAALPSQMEILIALSELPDDNIKQNYALNTFLYSVCTFLESPVYSQMCGFQSYDMKMEKLFGKENLELLSSDYVVMDRDGIHTKNGKKFSKRSVLGHTAKSTDYAPAIWDQACTSNFSSRNGTAISAITLHTVQGSYASCISWFNNCSASVSAHYVLRSSDGQVTQMVLEADKAWHVGSENAYTIGYEHEGFVDDASYYTTAMYTSSANLTKDICNSGYGIDPKRCFWGPATTGIYVVNCPKIKGHQNYQNQTHTDPGINWDWNYYYKLVNSARTATTYTAATGSLYDSGGSSGDYANNEGGLWLIAPAGAASVTLNFSAFNVEANWDYLYIYDGNTVYSPLIGVYTGTSSPGTVTASSGSMLIEFRSDCATVGSGWAASWTSSTGTTNPANLSISQAACPSNDVTFNWNNSGTGWYIALSTDPTFATYYWKWVSGLTTYTGFSGFVDHIDGTPITFQPGTTYYWYMRANGANTSGPSFTTHTCVSPTPANMSVTAPTCGSQTATFNWTNSGSAWTIDVSTDSTFVSKSSKAISSVITTTAPAGFSPTFTFHHSTKYFWRIFNGSVYTYGPSFMSPMCDSTAPTTAVVVNGTWQTDDFNADFTDEDDATGTGIEKGYYQVLEYNGSEWHANTTQGFWGDSFDNSIGSNYSATAGSWSINAGTLKQTDSVNANTNIYLPLTQNLSNRYLYQFKIRMNTLSGNRRFGFHFFADSGSADNRGNSYFIWFRANTSGSNTLEFYKCSWSSGSNINTQVKVIDPVTTVKGQWYDIKIIYDRISGEIDVFRDDKLLGSYTDPSPLSTGKYMGFRTGSCSISVDDFRVYRSRYPNVTVSVGAASSDMARTENPDPSTYACRINSIAQDFANNLSLTGYSNVNIDRTPPSAPAGVSDGPATDVDTIYSSILAAHWGTSTDPNSGISEFRYAVGTTPGDSNTIGWTSSGLSTSFSNSSISLISGQIYYVSVKALNGAGLWSNLSSSDGQRYIDVTGITENQNPQTGSIYPNPVSGQAVLKLQMEKSGSCVLELVNTKGKRIKVFSPVQVNSGSNMINLDLTDLAQGLYFLRVITDDKVQLLKFSKL
jgi:N-acetyl-anhydromuramyl-L-alanine amidase AmpD